MALGDVNVQPLWQSLAPAQVDRGPHVRDWLGNVWPTGTFPALPDLSWAGPILPVDGDGFRAGPLEWAAFAIAVSLAMADTRPPTLMEMGASQAPWCLSWVRALPGKINGSRMVLAVAFEAAAGSRTTRHFWQEQGLNVIVSPRVGGGLELTGDGWAVSWREQAVVQGGGVVHFPDVDISADNGAQAVRDTELVDYRGQRHHYRLVPGIDPADAIYDAGYVHFLHLDIQGGEKEILAANAFGRVRGRIGVLMLGTHSRDAEALAFDLLPGTGFFLLDEDPCLYEVHQGRPQLVRDGEQLWLSVEAMEHLHGRGLLRDPEDVARARARTQRPDLCRKESASALGGANGAVAVGNTIRHLLRRRRRELGGRPSALHEDPPQT